MGPSGQPDYVNAVAAARTAIDPFALLDILQAIEGQHGRVRTGERWGPRTLDLDLLLYGAERIDSPRLTVPHRGIEERAFVLYPMEEIAPDIEIPGKGPIGDLLTRCASEGLQPIQD